MAYNVIVDTAVDLSRTEIALNMSDIEIKSKKGMKCHTTYPHDPRKSGTIFA